MYRDYSTTFLPGSTCVWILRWSLYPHPLCSMARPSSVANHLTQLRGGFAWGLRQSIGHVASASGNAKNRASDASEGGKGSTESPSVKLHSGATETHESHKLRSWSYWKSSSISRYIALSSLMNGHLTIMGNFLLWKPVRPDLLPVHIQGIIRLHNLAWLNIDDHRRSQ